jgi:hypothetical protein
MRNDRSRRPWSSVEIEASWLLVWRDWADDCCRCRLGVLRLAFGVCSSSSHTNARSIKPSSVLGVSSFSATMHMQTTQAANPPLFKQVFQLKVKIIDHLYCWTRCRMYPRPAQHLFYPQPSSRPRQTHRQKWFPPIESGS